MPLACFQCVDTLPFASKHAEGMSLRYGVLRDCHCFLPITHSFHQGFFAVKRRAVFILGAKWIALVRGWRRDCVVGGMETRFQWRKAHSRTAKCEAFHIAPRLFFMFLFLISLTIRQHCIIYPQEFSTEPVFVQWNMPGMSLRYVGLLDSMSRFFFGVVAFGNLLRYGTVSLI